MCEGTHEMQTPWMIASTGEDSLLQIWKPAEPIYMDLDMRRVRVYDYGLFVCKQE